MSRAKDMTATYVLAAFCLGLALGLVLPAVVARLAGFCT